MLNKNIYLITIICLLTKTAVIVGQDDFKKWLERDQSAFQKFISEDDKKFANFLREDWKKFQIHKGLVADETPKPIKTPVVETPNVKPKPEKPTETNDPSEIKRPGTESPKSPVAQLDIDVTQYPVVATLNLYETNIQFMYPLDIKIDIENELNNQVVGKFWEELSSKQYEGLVEQALAYKKSMKLNDWGYIQLIKKIVEQVYPESGNTKQLYIWFLLTKSGYKAKTGIINNKAYILIASMNKIFGVPYLNTSANSLRMYIFDLDGNMGKISGSLFTFDKDYPGADKDLDMRILSSPLINNLVESKTLNFSYEQKEYKIKVEYSKGIIEYYKDYPYTNLEVYFEAAVAEKATKSLADQLNPILNNKSQREAVNILLAFVQFSFGYKTDQQNFNREKPLFVEETLFYKYSDCEDRSVLFSYLVRNILGLQVVGIDYPGHVATAIKFTEEIEGDYIMHNGEKYVICDPTYLGANAGMVIKEYKGMSNFSVIEI